MSDDRTDVAFPLTELRLGPVSLMAPNREPRQIEGAHGHLWQWVGDGKPLLSLSVAVRETRLGTSANGVARHLRWEVDQARARLGDDHQVQVEEVPVEVPGAPGARAATVDGVRDGMGVRTGLVVCTDTELMHVVEVAVADTAEGRSLAQEAMLGIHVHPWTLPR